MSELNCTECYGYDVMVLCVGDTNSSSVETTILIYCFAGEKSPLDISR